MRHLFIRIAITALLCSTTFLAEASCLTPREPVQTKPGGESAWSRMASTPVNIPAYVRVNAPVDRVKLYAIKGASKQLVTLNDKGIAQWNQSIPALWRFEATCDGLPIGSATIEHTAEIDVLSYVRPGGIHGLRSAVTTNKVNPWRTYSYNNGMIGERLPGFFITKGSADWETGKVLQFEQMIYDNDWIYLVRDTSWDSKCISDMAPVGMIQFIQQGPTQVRGGRHFPRRIESGASVDTGPKRIQGVKKMYDWSFVPLDEGDWCEAVHSGWSTSVVRADVHTAWMIGGKRVENVLRLSILDGVGAGDNWWFAHGIGLVQFKDEEQLEYMIAVDYPRDYVARIPCEPGPPCM
jgi:hypothetical protein